jgi:hypothetical protein
MNAAPSAVNFGLLFGLSFFLGLAFEDFFAHEATKRPGGIRTFPMLALAGGMLYLFDPVHLLPFTGGLLVTSSYTLGRGWSYVNGDSNTTIATPADIQRSWARTDQDRLHSWVESFLYQIPVGPGKKWLNDGGAVSQILGGWQLSGIFSAQSGSPIGITMSAATLNAPGNTQRPDVSGTPKVLGGIGSGVLWFDTSVFSSPAANTFGNSPRNGVLDGPKYVNLDATIAKLLSFNKVKGEIRVDIFNITNTPHFNNPNGTFLGATFGQITSTVANSERSMRFGFRLMF